MMKYICFLCFCLLFAGCASENEIPHGAESAADSSAGSSVMSSSSDPSELSYQAIKTAGLTAQETIEKFFELQYKAYIDLDYIDMSHLMDMSITANQNSAVWLKTLIQRRRLLAENHDCYVERQAYPYTITYDQEPEDIRMEFWKNRGISNEDELTIHFTITGEKSRAYPPVFAMNAQHTMRLKQVDDFWIITFHYFPGSVRRYGRNAKLELPSEEKMLEELSREFREIPSDNQIDIPNGAFSYHGAKAAEYAKAYCQSPNPLFYDIGDWMGNCANFTSQCILNGFGEGENEPSFMTSEWYAGAGGGSPAWENVQHFWNYAILQKQKGLRGYLVNSIKQLKTGGLVQVHTRNSGGDGFNHSLLLVDSSTLMFAQNSPGCFVYYSDLVNVDLRFFNPAYFIK
ncbi:amidase domain-containing protein [Marasmitruncus massiliensis]|uniref:amidase domain-containing protein n=1 Tax=Marasmitruncus massiliensis TaxID=1944642 RepID=UPI000C7E10F1|nr:amidase domain-containing protein [Marasmitruncus massiliensis]MBE6906742.1 hypothetical protein [Oscillospiraceae bacterium]